MHVAGCRHGFWATTPFPSSILSFPHRLLLKIREELSQKSLQLEPEYCTSTWPYSNVSVSSRHPITALPFWTNILVLVRSSSGFDARNVSSIIVRGGFAKMSRLVLSDLHLHMLFLNDSFVDEVRSTATTPLYPPLIFFELFLT